MLDAKQIHSLPRLTPPVLTAYLQTNPADARNQGHPPGYLIYLKSRGKLIGTRIPKEDQKLLRDQLQRAEEYLQHHPPRTPGVLVVAGPKAWVMLPLHVEVEDELHWGRPSLTQFLWLLDEHRPCGAVAVDRSGARFYRLWMGDAEEQKKEKFVVDSSQWRQKRLVSGGRQRDEFEQRVEAHYTRIYRETAGRIREWAEREKLDPVFLAGPNEVVEPVWAELPKTFQERVALVKGDVSRVTLPQLLEKLEPEIRRWEREHELKTVDRMLVGRNGTRAVLGIDETLAQVQQGGARGLVVARGLGGKLRQCVKCGWTDRAADPECSACGGERRVIALRAALPELARRYGVPVEVVAGEAGRKLREHGGLACWLR